MRIAEMTPGMAFKTSLGTVVFLGMVKPHPVRMWGNRGFVLVIWWMYADKKWSFDCLSPNMVCEGNGLDLIDSEESRQVILHHIISQGWM